eukprot:CAMPEP_0175059390 /NCGR_PEP_ID=MMETSP0052_2-20121109/12407_1 /TAXON_ID=51329 ORGANISM="Polytomella parva, Strain SAG 63-3" /NCGR_SAMPLE_ID=MMETSP0052_2 /ASSEMBLY_ACC=CAM_ASM_000194 /LENGTH=464 /DNA_ID=CAMNT_0016324937 /DNA_START=42 /DNA_END=1436 /DNA_ORIENTATION=+
MAGSINSFAVASWLAISERCKPISFTKPQQIAYWSEKAKDNEIIKEYLGTNALYRYFPPAPGSRLDEGFNGPNFIRKIEKPKTSIGVTDIIEVSRYVPISWKDYHICTFRNNLNKIGGTISSPKEPWSIITVREGNVLFLEVVDNPDKQSYNDAAFLSYQGSKFESICTGRQLVDLNESFVSVVRYRLGAMKLLMAAEIDCTRTTDPSPFSDHIFQGRESAISNPRIENYVELKTQVKRDDNYRGNMAQKMPKWWLQSFIAGVPVITVGVRNPNGSLSGTEDFDVQNLPLVSKREGCGFDGWRTLRFIEAVLTWMYDKAAELGGEGERVDQGPKTQTEWVEKEQGRVSVKREREKCSNDDDEEENRRYQRIRGSKTKMYEAVRFDYLPNLMEIRASIVEETANEKNGSSSSNEKGPEKVTRINEREGQKVEVPTKSYAMAENVRESIATAARYRDGGRAGRGKR